MDIELKGKFDDLDDLLSGGYISKEEFAAARENLLIEAGFDVSPRTGGFISGLAFRRSEEESRKGCGCFLMLLLLIAVLIGGFLALPDGILKGIPVIGDLIEGQGIQGMRQSVMRFIDDLRGNPAPDAQNERGESEIENAAPAKPEEEDDSNKGNKVNEIKYDEDEDDDESERMKIKKIEELEEKTGTTKTRRMRYEPD